MSSPLKAASLFSPTATPSLGGVTDSIANLLASLPWRDPADEPLASELLQFIADENGVQLSGNHYLAIDVDKMPWHLLCEADKPILLMTHAGYFMQSFHGPMRHTIWDVVVERMGLDVAVCLSGEASSEIGEAHHYVFVPRQELARLGAEPGRPRKNPNTRDRGLHA